ncbi:MAG: hypothetical protein ACREOM_11230 [Candidatus Dormibacteraceae bacterium]
MLVPPPAHVSGPRVDGREKPDAFLADMRELIAGEFSGRVTKRFVTTLTPYRLG